MPCLSLAKGRVLTGCRTAARSPLFNNITEVFPTNEKRKVILDVDTGSDDAVAIMAAVCAPELEVLGVCSVAGNQPIDNTTENTLRVMQLLGSDIPVYRGASGPLVAQLDYRRQKMAFNLKPEEVEAGGKKIRMHDAYLDLPAATIKTQNLPAAMFIVDAVRKADSKVTLLPVGPLTNIALALKLDPTIVNNIEEIILMGGGHAVFNHTSASEFNIWFDPEAAEIVLQSGAKITMVPLDATHAASLSLDDAKALRGLHTPQADFAAEMIEHRVEVHNADGQMGGAKNLAPIHDALVVCAAIDPSVLTDVRFMRVDVDCSGGYADGQTLCDTRALPTKPRNCHVALDADPKKFGQMLLERLG